MNTASEGNSSLNNVDNVLCMMVLYRERLWYGEDTLHLCLGVSSRITAAAIRDFLILSMKCLSLTSMRHLGMEMFIIRMSPFMSPDNWHLVLMIPTIGSESMGEKLEDVEDTAAITTSSTSALVSLLMR